MAAAPQGHDLDGFVGDVPARLICQQQHLFCYDCLKDIPPLACRRCLICKEVVVSHRITKSNLARDLVNCLQAYCINKDRGCSWTGGLGSLKVHDKLCAYADVNCDNAENGCPLRLERRLMPDHLNSACEWAMVECERGGLKCERFARRAIKNHEGVCEYWRCSRGCGAAGSRAQLDWHVASCVQSQETIRAQELIISDRDRELEEKELRIEELEAELEALKKSESTAKRKKKRVKREEEDDVAGMNGESFKKVKLETG
ncbi:hypothetical protein MNV49_002199 [Pseudohyphozyma bogoriensis]|nr:hypothetical protein MNV49_002199 [Pseudohyphozyma bogoriensis]